MAREAVAVLERTDYVVQRAEGLVALARVCEAAGESLEAVEAARAALVLYERKEHAVGAEEVRTTLEALAAPDTV
jgi:hypothetical protein